MTLRTLSRRHLAIALSLALLAGGALVGCGSQFADISETSSGKTEIVYDNSALDALEGAFERCVEPLTIEAGMSSVSLAGSCDTDGMTSDEFVVAIGLAAAGSIELGTEIPSLITSSTEVIDGLPWPVQNCEIRVNMDVYFDQIKLYDLAASWTSSGGDPQLRIDFDFQENKVGEVDIDIEVDCPSSVSAWIVNAVSSELQSELQGTHDIMTSSRDLDLIFTFDHSGATLTADLDLDFDVGNLWLDLDWSRVETINVLWWEIDVIDNEDVEEPARALFESLGDEMLTAALADLPATVADMFAEPIEDGHTICSVSATSSSMTITTAEGVGPLPCLTKVPVNKVLVGP